MILWWQSSEREVSTREVALCLIILPIAILATIAFFKRYLDRKAATLPAQVETSAQPASQNAGDQAARKTSPLPILGAWCISSAGSNLEDFHQALLDKTQRPLPDAAMPGDDGYPLFTARIRDLDAALKDAQEDFPSRPAVSRTLAMLSRVMQQVELEWPLMSQGQNDSASANGLPTLRSNDPAAASRQARIRLQIKLVIPAEFSPDEQHRALEWLHEAAEVLPVAAEDRQIDVIPAQDDATTLLLTERFRNDDGVPEALLIIAAASALCPASLETLQAEQRLFGNRHLQGVMPGEAAFAILCANRRALQFAVQQPACLLQPVTVCNRTASADDGAKPTHISLAAAAAEALEAANLSGEAIGAIACDADHRRSRVLECIGAMLQHTPQLDAIADRLAVNETCGHIGAASSAGSLVAGIAQTLRGGQPVLVFSVSHAFERAAAVLLPANDYASPA